MSTKINPDRLCVYRHKTRAKIQRLRDQFDRACHPTTMYPERGEWVLHVENTTQRFRDLQCERAKFPCPTPPKS